MIPWLYILCDLVSVLILFLHDTLMLYVQSNYWRKFGETWQGIWDALNKPDFFRLPSAIPDTCSFCEKYWPQETDKSNSNFHYSPEINNC